MAAARLNAARAAADRYQGERVQVPDRLHQTGVGERRGVVPGQGDGRQAGRRGQGDGHEPGAEGDCAEGPRSTFGRPQKRSHAPEEPDEEEGRQRAHRGCQEDVDAVVDEVTLDVQVRGAECRGTAGHGPQTDLERHEDDPHARTEAFQWSCGAGRSLRAQPRRS